MYVLKMFEDPRVNKKPQNEERQTTQWPKEKGQKDKQRSTKHYTENKRLSNANPLKLGVNSCALEV
jgi:hypothetical protein